MPLITYNTDDPNATAMGYTNPGAGDVVIIGPLLTGAYARALGSFYCDQAGTLVIQQSFDYFVNTATGPLNPTPHWDVAGYTPEPPLPSALLFPSSSLFPGGGTGAVTADTPYIIDTDVIAPVLQLVYTNGATPANHLRIFLRLISLDTRG